MLATVDPLNVGMLIATWVAALAALSATIVTYRIFRSETDPNVIVYASHDESRPTCILLVIKNVGRGLARDVTFTSSEAIPGRAFGLVAEDATDAEQIDTGPLVNGIPSLGPDQARTILWGQYGGLSRALGNRVIYVTCNFRNSRSEQIEPTVCPLEIHSFAGVDAVDPDGARRAAKYLEVISRDIHSLVEGIGRR